MKLIDFLRVFDDSHEVIELWQDNEDTNPRKENVCLYDGSTINEKYEPGIAADHILMGKWFDCEITSISLDYEYLTPLLVIFVKVPQDLHTL